MQGKEKLSSIEAALEAARTQHGESMSGLTQAGPVLLVFLRNFG